MVTLLFGQNFLIFMCFIFVILLEGHYPFTTRKFFYTNWPETSEVLLFGNASRSFSVIYLSASSFSEISKSVASTFNSQIYKDFIL